MSYYGDIKWDIQTEILPFFQNEADSSSEYESEAAYQKSDEYKQKQQRYWNIVNLFFSNEDDISAMRAHDCVQTYLMETLPRDVKTSTIAYFMCRPHLERHPYYAQDTDAPELQEHQIEGLADINAVYDIFATHDTITDMEEAFYEDASHFSASKYAEYCIEVARIDHIVRTDNDLRYNASEEEFDMNEVKAFVDHSIGFNNALGNSSNSRLNTRISELNDQLVDFYCRAQACTTSTSNNLAPKP